MKPVVSRVRTTSIVVGFLMATGVTAAVMMPLWIGLASLAACAYGALLAYGRQVYIDCLNGQEML